MKVSDIKEVLLNRDFCGEVLLDEPMKKHTYFRIGGNADVLVLPKKIEDVILVLKVCNELGIEFCIVGNGTNLLVTDKGIRGVVIKLAENISDIKVNGNNIKVQCGALLSTVAKIALKSSLTGMEGGSGIPGSIGGAVAMNAGAYGFEMSQIVTKVKCVDNKGNLYIYNNDELNFGYRNSKAQDDNLIVLEVELELEKGNYEEIKVYMDELTVKRTTKQPLHLPSAGSTFKRPEGDYASRLIQEAGLKGMRFKDAQVSDKHCGFIVNLGNATAEDVMNLIKIVQKTVNDKFGVMLETEVKIIGEL
ncbi:UDP-N-acetylmuramate dehydrogenase [Abyssisolibacter fermentans]|uniref:UDP-N-acetylmuramate dehydrogenase n=1 Tax=Abyssisolibacter fermentans TaxID=1766203 RepID=UPI000829ABA2|nr:UDP-N-acetylmuramate dehydrogenase [Abyssisolibacter fermentans]